MFTAFSYYRNDSNKVIAICLYQITGVKMQIYLGRAVEFYFHVRSLLSPLPFSSLGLTELPCNAVGISQQQAVSVTPTAFSSLAKQTGGTVGNRTEALLQCLCKTAGDSVRNHHKDVGLDFVG